MVGAVLAVPLPDERLHLGRGLALRHPEEQFVTLTMAARAAESSDAAGRADWSSAVSVTGMLAGDAT